MKQLLLLLALAGIPAPLSAAETRPRLQSPKAIADFATKHCVACHDPKNPKGGFDFATMLIEKDVSVSPASWRSVLDRVALRDMPPKKHPTRPSGEEYQRAEEWVRGQLTAHEAIAATQRPRPMRRLNRVEYNRSVSELLGLPVSPADDFPPDDQLLGFTNIAESLNFSTTLLEQYLIAAEKVADLAFIKGDQPATKKQSHTWGNDDTKRSDGAIYPFHPNAHSVQCPGQGLVGREPPGRHDWRARPGLLSLQTQCDSAFCGQTNDHPPFSSPDGRENHSGNRRARARRCPHEP